MLLVFWPVCHWAVLGTAPAAAVIVFAHWSAMQSEALRSLRRGGMTAGAALVLFKTAPLALSKRTSTAWLARLQLFKEHLTEPAFVSYFITLCIATAFLLYIRPAADTTASLFTDTR